jgi:hypothetical protein
MQSATPNLGGNDRYCSLRTFETGRFQGEGNDRWPGSLALRSYRGPPRGSPKYDGLSPPVEAVSFVPDSKKLPAPERAGKLRCRVGSEFGRYQRAPNLSKSAANVWSKKLTRTFRTRTLEERILPPRLIPMNELAMDFPSELIDNGYLKVLVVTQAVVAEMPRKLSAVRDSFKIALEVDPDPISKRDANFSYQKRTFASRTSNRFSYGTSRTRCDYRKRRSCSGVNHPKNLQQPDHTSLCFREHRAWLPRHISDHGWNRTRSESPTHWDLHLVQFSSMPPR